MIMKMQLYRRVKMKQWNDRRYFTLDDIKNDLGILTQYSGPLAMRASNELPEAFISAILDKCGCSDSALVLSNQAHILFQDYLWPRFYNQYICYTDDTSIADDDSEDVIVDKIGQIIAWIQSSDDKYSLLISNLEANKNKLLGQIKSSSVNRFNDVPQNQGSYEDDAHNSTVTKTETATDGTTLLSRLNEIEDNLKRLYIDWSNEFRRFIIWSVQ